MKNNSRLLAILSAALLSGCSTLDAINPFDKTEAQKRAEQGEVAGEDQRISILELSETLTVAAPTPPEQILLPDPYVNTDWPQTGGNVQHVVQHTAAIKKGSAAVLPSIIIQFSWHRASARWWRSMHRRASCYGRAKLGFR